MNNKNQIGIPIKTLNKLYSFATNKKSVFVKRLNKVLPAAFVIHLQGYLLCRYLNNNWILEYRKKK